MTARCLDGFVQLLRDLGKRADLTTCKRKAHRLAQMVNASDRALVVDASGRVGRPELHTPFPLQVCLAPGRVGERGENFRQQQPDLTKIILMKNPGTFTPPMPCGQTIETTSRRYIVQQCFREDVGPAAHRHPCVSQLLRFAIDSADEGPVRVFESVGQQLPRRDAEHIVRTRQA